MHVNHYSKLHIYSSNIHTNLLSAFLFASSIQIPESFSQAFYKHQKAKGRFEKSASWSKGSLTQQVLSLFNSSMLLHTLSAILHVSSSAHKSWFFFRVRCPEMQQKQSSLERQALLLFYGPILLSNVINEHINFTHYINSACVRVNVWGCVWL